MTTNQERAAEILSEYDLEPPQSDFAAHALADAGLITPDLPEPGKKNTWKTELFGNGFFANREPGVVDLVRNDGVRSYPVEVFRREALRMLAVANHAEQEQ